MHSFKYLITIMLLSIFMLSSCVKDKYSVRKDILLEFYEKMDKALLANDKKWFEKNFYEYEESKLDENIIFSNGDSLKNFNIVDDESHHSISFLYNAGFDTFSSHLGSAAIMIRDSRFEKQYYYIRLFFDERKNKWFIDEIIFGTTA